MLVTRPLEDAEATARALALRGHQALLAPLLATHFQDGAEIGLEGIQAVLATSANGVRALGRRSIRRDLPLFAVGPQTAENARSAGFAQVRSADGDARALAEAVTGWADPKAGALLHVHGAHGGGDLAQGLRGRGFAVREETLYAVEPQPLGPDAAAALSANALDAALFFSPRSARIFRQAVEEAQLPTAGLIAVCISAATAAALEGLPFRERRIAAAPNQDALLDCLEKNPGG